MQRHTFTPTVIEIVAACVLGVTALLVCADLTPGAHGHDAVIDVTLAVAAGVVVCQGLMTPWDGGQTDVARRARAGTEAISAPRYRPRVDMEAAPAHDQRDRASTIAVVSHGLATGLGGALVLAGPHRRDRAADVRRAREEHYDG